MWDRIFKLPKIAGHCGKKFRCVQCLIIGPNKAFFWEFLYWGKLLFCHNLDVMYIGKNVCEQIIHKIMDVKGKTKDDVSARRDLL